MTIHISWAVGTREVPDEPLIAAAEAALVDGGRGGLDVDVVMVDEARLTELHARFLGDPTPTDVITFDLGEEGGSPAAELYVSVDCARREGAQRGLELGRELALYVVHGALHLCGLDDHTPEQTKLMRAAERRVLASLGYSPELE